MTFSVSVMHKCDSPLGLGILVLIAVALGFAAFFSVGTTDALLTAFFGADEIKEGTADNGK